MKKLNFSSELAYFIGLPLIAFATALAVEADFGVSMVVAPAYILYAKLNSYFTFFTYGMAEYVLQAFLLIVLMIVVRKFRPYFLLSFVSAIFYGILLDCSMWIVSLLPFDNLYYRILLFVISLPLTTLGIAIILRSYFAPEVYELFIKECAKKLNLSNAKFKLFYDLASCAISIILSFILFGLWHFEGVNVGTIICALISGPLVGLFTKLLDSLFIFKDYLPLKKYFE